MKAWIFDRSLGNGYSMGLAGGLRAEDLDVTICGPADASFQHDRVAYPRGAVRKRAAKTWDAVGAVPRTIVALIRERPNVAHFQWGEVLDLAYARVARSSAANVLVFTVHNPAKRIGDPIRPKQDALIELANAVITHGPLMREQILERHPTLTSRVHVVELGNYDHVITRTPRRDARRVLGLPAGVSVFAFIGRIQPRKGIETLVEAFRLYRASGGAGHLVLAGSVSEHSYECELKQAALRDDLSIHWFTATSRLPQDLIDLVASAATQIVLPFHDVSQSASALFAMTHGRCLVTTDIGEIGRTVGEHGILVPPRTPDALAQALQLSDLEPDRCDRLGASARRFVLNHRDWREIAAQTIAIYREALRQ
jgi:glycosyltransferase involved in cell wall biosynthesis